MHELFLINSVDISVLLLHPYKIYLAVRLKVKYMSITNAHVSHNIKQG
jgi:hypothetical protein